MKVSPICYRIFPKHPEAHIFEVSCTVDKPDPKGQQFGLPAWIPGSYMIREFARNIVRIRAERAGKAVSIEKLDKHTWLAGVCSGSLSVIYEVYAWDQSVRAAYLDIRRGFFNGSSVFLSIAGAERSPCMIDILPPKGRAYKKWRVATTLPCAGAQPYGFGRYSAQDYEELIDHPVAMGNFTLASFKAAAVPHDIVIIGRHSADLGRLQRDLKKLCERHIGFFGGKPPMDQYMFLVNAVGQGYGGLEHRSSTALLCSRDDFPALGQSGVNDKYQNFLGLCSHEYFHTWNVKRIKPKAFIPYDLNRENYTRLLWVFEGITSYYDDLALLRAGLVSPQRYLEILGKTITGVLRASGRKKQSIADSSFDAWIKYYHQDENSSNAIVSYYTKGSLIALALDLHIRFNTKGKTSLDHVMRVLWKDYGEPGIGLAEDEFERVAEKVSGLDLSEFFENAVRSTEDLPLQSLLQKFGVSLQMRAAESIADKGGKPAGKGRTDLARRPYFGAATASAGSDVKLMQVFDAGAAQSAGLSAGDVLVAIDGLRVTPSNFETLLNCRTAGSKVVMHAFRGDELMTFSVTFLATPIDTCCLGMVENPDKNVLTRREAWLGIRRS